MKIIYPYYYDVMEIPPRCRKPRPVQYTGELEVEIREPSEAEAPVALIQHSRYHCGDDIGPWEEHPFRWYDGQLWVRRDPNNPYRSRSAPYALILPTEPHYITRYYGSDNGQKGAEEHVREWAEAKILIDGQLWRPWLEPLIFVSKNNGFRSGVHFRMEVDYSDRGYGNAIWYYPLTMWDGIYEVIRKLAGSDEMFWSPEHIRFDILLKDAIRRPIYYHYQFRLGGKGVSVLLEVEAVTEEDALRKVRAGLTKIYPDLQLRSPSETILCWPKIEFCPDEIDRLDQVGRVTGLDKLIGNQEI